MKLLRKLKGKIGFTLAELLIVIMLLAIVMAIAVPNVAAYARRIQLTELDDSARAIYMAAQNKLDSLKAVQTDLTFGGDAQEISLPARYNKGEGVTPLADGPSVSPTINYISDEAGNISSFINAGSIESELFENHYLIEYDAVMGFVYGVFYSDQTDIEANYAANGGEVPTAFEERLEKSDLIGYYGSEEGYISVEKPDEIPTPKVTHFNTEKLGVIIENPSTAEAYLTVEVNGINIVRGESYLTGGGKVKLILDSLYPESGSGRDFNPIATGTVERSFADWKSDFSIPVELGGDINVVVTFYDKGGVALSKSSNAITLNSYFASVSGDTAKIEYGRHLQNLGNLESGTIKSAYIAGTIDFSKSEATDDYRNWNASNTYASHYDFTPIDNDNIKTITAATASQIKYISVDGNGVFSAFENVSASGITFYRPVIKGGTNNSGVLAGTVAGTTAINNITVINAKVNGSNAGGVVGTMTGGTIDGAKVYVETDDAVTSWSEPTSDPHSTYTINGSSNAGGLVGVVNNGTAISNSYASVRVDSSSGNAGGLVGTSNSSVTLKNSYAGGHTYGGQYKYADEKDPLINVSGQRAGGIIGLANGSVNIEGVVYSTCSVKGTTAVDTAFNVSGSVNADGATCYAAGYAYESDGTVTKKSSHYDDGVLSGADESIKESTSKNNYDSGLDKYLYPYKGLSVHHGDWLNDDNPIVSLGFFYWEKEPDPENRSVSYNFHEFYTNYNEDGSANSGNRSNLCTGEDAFEITEYGYGYYYIGDVTVNGDFVLDDDVDNTARDEAIAYIGLDGDYTLVMGYGKSADESHGEDVKFSFTVDSDGVTYAYTYNPDFYAIAEGSVTFGTEENPYQVRTLAHLQHIEAYLTDNFVQSHDIVGNGHKHRPIGDEDYDGYRFTGTYDGQSYRIINLDIDDSGSYVGIFGVTEGATLKNIILFAPVDNDNSNTGGKTINLSGSNIYAGGIVGYAKVGPTTISLPNPLPVTSLSSVRQSGLTATALVNATSGVATIAAYNGHVYSDDCVFAWSDIAPTYHNGYCNTHNMQFGWEAHILADDSNQCIVCGYVHNEHQYDYNSWKTEENASTHWHACTVCGAKTDETAHTPNGVSNPQPGEWYQCNVCWQYFQYSSCDVHTYGDEWKSDDNSHWRECVDCGSKVDVEAHTFSAPVDNNNGTHTGTCNVCRNTVTTAHSPEGGYKPNGSNQHIGDCVCGAFMGAPHNPSNWITDVVATAVTDGLKHRECTECGYIIEEQVIPMGKDPNDCPYCESSNTKYMGNQGDDYGHFRHCDSCGKDFQVEHNLIVYDSGANTDGGAPIAQLGKYDSRLGREVTLDDLKELLYYNQPFQVNHYHHCEDCQKLVFFPLTLDEIRTEPGGYLQHRIICIYCNGSVLLQYHDEDDCILCGGFHEDHTPEPEGAAIYNCAVAGYTFIDSSNGSSYIGGIAGKSEVTIGRCEAVVDIQVSGSRSNTSIGCFGGIVGETAQWVSLSYSGGNMSVNSTFGTNGANTYIGGVAGKNSDDDEKPVGHNSYSYMKLTSKPTGANAIPDDHINAIAPHAASNCSAISGNGFDSTTSALEKSLQSPLTFITKSDELDHVKNTRKDYQYQPVIIDARNKNYEHYGCLVK